MIGILTVSSEKSSFCWARDASVGLPDNFLALVKYRLHNKSPSNNAAASDVNKTFRGRSPVSVACGAGFEILPCVVVSETEDVVVGTDNAFHAGCVPAGWLLVSVVVPLSRVPVLMLF